MLPSLIRLLAGQTVSQTGMSGLRAALPIYALHQGYGATDIGLIVACFSASNLVLSVPIGRLVDRRGLQFPWRGSVWLALLAASVCAAWPSLAGICLAAMLSGTSAALSQMAAQHHVIVSSANPQERAESIGWIMTAPAGAALFGPMLMGVLLDRAGRAPADQQALWAVCAALALLALCSQWIIRSVPERPVTPPMLSAPVPGAPTGRWALLANPRFRMVLVVNTLSFTCWNAFLLIMPVLGHERGLSATLIGAIFGAFSVTAAVSRPLLPRLMRKVPRRWLLIGTNLGCALIFASLVWVEAGWAYLLCASLLGLTLGSVQVLLLTNLSDESPADKQGEAMGLRMMTYSATSVVMPIAFGVVGALLGQTVVLLITAGVAAAAAALSTRLERGRVDPP